MSKFNVGDKVRCLGKHHNIDPDFYPENGTVGEIIREVPNDNTQAYKVWWKAGSTSGDDRWWAYNDDIELVPAASAQKIVITTDGVTTLARLYDGKKVVRNAEAKCSPSDTFDLFAGAQLALDRLKANPAEPKPAAPGFSQERYDMAKRICHISDICISFENHERKHDCPFFKMDRGGMGCCHYAATHPETQKLMEDYLKAEAEPEKPKYYTGKVVCVKSGYPWWTVGKVYNIVNGTITANDGDKYRGYISAEDARHAGRRTNSEPFPGSDAGHNPDNEFIPFVEG